MKKHKASQKQWAGKYKHWSMDDWACVIWSNECYVYISDDWGTVWVTRSADEAWDDDCVVPTFKQSSIRIMVWACIMQGSKGPLVVLDYFLQMAEERGQVVFQQDRAPSH